jgi:PAS domain S-box-containing protein
MRITTKGSKDKCAGRRTETAEESEGAIIGRDLGGVVTTWSRGAVRLFGYTANEMIGTRLSRITPLELQEVEQHIWSSALRGVNIISYQSERLNKAGHLIGVAVTLLPVRDEQGRLLGISTVCRNLNDRKLSEEILLSLNARLAAEIEQRMAEIREKDGMLLILGRRAATGEMIGNIAHQWRQPLNALGLLVQDLSLSCEMGILSHEQVLKSSRKSMELVNHLSKTIDDFRSFLKVDKKKVPFKVSETIASSLSLLAGRLKDEQIAVACDVQDDTVTITGYRNEFVQVLLNILNNAGDAFAERKVMEPSIHIGVAREDDRALVTITDNAGGIQEEVMDKIFDPYFTTKNDHQGSGIGLFMSKTIIERRLGGQLTVRNVESGAQFSIHL